MVLELKFLLWQHSLSHFVSMLCCMLWQLGTKLVLALLLLVDACCDCCMLLLLGLVITNAYKF